MAVIILGHGEGGNGRFELVAEVGIKFESDVLFSLSRLLKTQQPVFAGAFFYFHASVKNVAVDGFKFRFGDTS